MQLEMKRPVEMREDVRREQNPNSCTVKPEYPRGIFVTGQSVNANVILSCFSRGTLAAFVPRD